jgi:2-phosphosulfolactate phosphatase
MPQQIHVAFLPQLLHPAEVQDCYMVVTDVLRASTTIISALNNGIVEVIPCAEIPEALALKSQWGDKALLGGERGGVIIPGFDQGTSPREFPTERVIGRRLVLCTTNGTVAMQDCRAAKRVWIGAFVNLSSVVTALRESPKVTVLCAGTDRKVTSEDVLFAGAVVQQLTDDHPSATLSDQARLARSAWRDALHCLCQPGETLAKLLGQGAGGRNLLKLGYLEDVQFCAEIDSIPVVPELNLQEWAIRLP